LIDTPRAKVQQLIAANVTAPTLLAATAVRAFVTRGRGGIINLASVLAFAPELFDGTYSGTKAFILNLTQGS
jgi:short-subunit dehydrogenase